MESRDLLLVERCRQHGRLWSNYRPREQSLSRSPYPESRTTSQMPIGGVRNVSSSLLTNPCAPLHFLASIRHGGWLTDTGTLHPTNRQCLVADQSRRVSDTIDPQSTSFRSRGESTRMLQL